MDLLKSPLYSKYAESNAKLVDFAGWEMPISFSGLIKEHESVRSVSYTHLTLPTTLTV